MRRLKGTDGNIFANEDIFEEIINNSRFRKFVGDCITHYLYTRTERMQDYPVPEDVSENFTTINISKITSGNKLYITENGILDE
jgi:hypothetical protein